MVLNIEDPDWTEDEMAVNKLLPQFEAILEPEYVKAYNENVGKSCGNMFRQRYY